MEPLSPVAELGSEPAKRAKTVRRKERKWPDMVGLPGLASAQAGMAGADAPTKGRVRGSPHLWALPASGRVVNGQCAFVPSAGEEHEQAGEGLRAASEAKAGDGAPEGE